MKRVDRCQKFGRDALALIASQGECFETAQWLAIQAGKITNGLTDRTLKACEWAGGVLDVKTESTVSLWAAYETPTDFRDPEKVIREAWDEILVILQEIAGLVPIRTHAREREWWTKHWVDLYVRGDDQMKADVVETALKSYPDFDLSLLRG